MALNPSRTEHVALRYHWKRDRLTSLLRCGVVAAPRMLIAVSQSAHVDTHAADLGVVKDSLLLKTEYILMLKLIEILHGKLDEMHGPRKRWQSLVLAYLASKETAN